MRNTKYLIGILLLFMTIGFAAISTSLSITGKTTVATTFDDFKVYFSDVKVNGVKDLSLRSCKTSPYYLLIVLSEYYWTSSAYAGGGDKLWVVNNSGYIVTSFYSNYQLVRPVITLSKTVLENYI